MMKTMLFLVCLMMTAHSSNLRGQEFPSKNRGKDFASEIEKNGLPHLLRLVDAGSVTFDFDDAKLSSLKKSAATEFVIDTSFRTRYQIKDSANGPVTTATVTVKYTNYKFQVTHKVTLPNEFDWQSKWYHVLLKHEFDHVAISSDPRIAILADKLFNQSDNFRINIGNGQSTEEAIERMVQNKFEERKIRLQKWIQDLYDELDQVSNLGRDAIPDRMAFFRNLYSEERLRKAELEDFKRIQPILRHKTFRNPESHFELLDLP